jgi:hypothetical protein
MTFIAHTENAKGKAHRLRDHLRGVGRLAGEFATAANPEMAQGRIGGAVERPSVVSTRGSKLMPALGIWEPFSSQVPVGRSFDV